MALTILTIWSGTVVARLIHREEAKVQEIHKLEERLQEGQQENETLKNKSEKLEKENEKLENKYQDLKEAKAKKKRVSVPKKVTVPKKVEHWRPLCEEYFGSKADECLMVMKGESGGNPNAVSHTDDHGLMQINAPVWSDFFNLTRKELKDPETNLKCARVIYDRAGGSWSPWVYARKIGL